MLPVLTMTAGVAVFIGGANWFYRQEPLPKQQSGKPGAEPVSIETLATEASQPSPTVNLGMKVTRATSATETPPPTQGDLRSGTKKALRAFYARVGDIIQRIGNAPSDESLDKLGRDMSAVQIEASTWVLKHMGEAANQKLRSGIRPAMGFPWPGEHSAESQLLRNKMMVTLMDMQTNLEAMMQSDTWDKQ